MRNIVGMVLEAQKRLILNPIDLAHDVTHHYRVYEWSLKINIKERLRADEDILTVSAWYHDLGGRRGEDISLIKNLLGKHTDDANFVDEIVNIIREHSFGKIQSNLESKILFDADKMEYVNPPRLLLFVKAHEEGLINDKKYEQYKKEWSERIEKVKDMLHFIYSKEKFLKLLPQAERIMRR